jgi:hypothetical protein
LTGDDTAATRVRPIDARVQPLAVGLDFESYRVAAVVPRCLDFEGDEAGVPTDGPARPSWGYQVSRLESVLDCIISSSRHLDAACLLSSTRSCLANL